MGHRTGTNSIRKELCSHRVYANSLARSLASNNLYRSERGLIMDKYEVSEMLLLWANELIDINKKQLKQEELNNIDKLRLKRISKEIEEILNEVENES